MRILQKWAVLYDSEVSSKASQTFLVLTVVFGSALGSNGIGAVGGTGGGGGPPCWEPELCSYAEREGQPWRGHLSLAHGLQPCCVVSDGFGL